MKGISQIKIFKVVKKRLSVLCAVLLWAMVATATTTTYGAYSVTAMNLDQQLTVPLKPQKQTDMFHHRTTSRKINYTYRVQGGKQKVVQSVYVSDKSIASKGANTSATQYRVWTTTGAGGNNTSITTMPYGSANSNTRSIGNTGNIASIASTASTASTMQYSSPLLRNVYIAGGVTLGDGTNGGEVGYYWDEEEEEWLPIPSQTHSYGETKTEDGKIYWWNGSEWIEGQPPEVDTIPIGDIPYWLIALFGIISVIIARIKTQRGHYTVQGGQRRTATVNQRGRDGVFHRLSNQRGRDAIF